jgi:glycine dehydrogenase subunit 1
MPFIPHTQTEVKQMLSTIGVESIEALFDEIPENLRIPQLEDVPDGMNEMQVSQFIHHIAQQQQLRYCFAGGGAYEHYIPAAVWQLATRGEFYSAYTPYQAEASQGTLQVIYEFQTMMAELTAMDVSNASLYDGASGLAEAVLMAVRLNRKVKSKCILMPKNVSPAYQKVVSAIVKNQGIHLQLIDIDSTQGTIDFSKLEQQTDAFVALVIPQPNYFGGLEEVHQLTDWAHAQGGLVIGLVNPMALSLLEAPGHWGEKGADIAVGEAQSLGIPLSSGGAYIGFIGCKQKLVRQLPGRIVGRTVDLEGKAGFTLTLQAREQHIRRSKATSNNCTNQGLMATAVTLYLAFLGVDGLQKVAASCIDNTRQLMALLDDVVGIEWPFGQQVFHEFVITLDVNVDDVLQCLAEQDIVAGINLSKTVRIETIASPNLLLICVTETKTSEELTFFAETLQTTMKKLRTKISLQGESA